MISAASVAISATPPRAAEFARRNWLARNGVNSTYTSVKMITAPMNPDALMSKSSRTSEATISPTALATTAMNVLTISRITRQP